MTSYAGKDVHALTSVYVYLTWRCNLRCIHCWVEGGEHETSEEVNTELITSLLDQAVDLGLKNIKFTGGEPTLCWDKIVSIVNHTKNKGLAYSIESNGLLLDEHKIMFAKENNITVSVSLNGRNAQINDKFTRIPGSFDTAIKAIGKMTELGYKPATLVASVYKGNISELAEDILFYDILGIETIKINPIISIGRGAALDRENALLDIEDHFELAKLIKSLQKIVKSNIFLHEPFCLRSYNSIKVNGAGRCGIKQLLSILPDGNISLCGYGGVDPRVILGKWNPDSHLQDVWSDHPVLSELRRIDGSNLKGACEKCLHKEICQGDCKILTFKEFGCWDMPLPLCHKMENNGVFPKSRVMVC